MAKDIFPHLFIKEPHKTLDYTSPKGGGDGSVLKIGQFKQNLFGAGCRFLRFFPPIG